MDTVFSIYTLIPVLAGIALTALIVFLMLKRVIPYERLNRTLKKYNETKDIRTLENMDYSGWPALQQTWDYLLGEERLANIVELKKQHAEYLALQNQINPHFLFNTLEAIRGDALEAGMISLADTTGALATYFRYTITEVDNLVTLEDELDNVENYYQIQRYRFGDRVTMHIEYPDEHLACLDVRLPKLTLQPIIENAITHGLEGKLTPGTIYLSFEMTKTDLIIHVKDNGVGIDTETVKKMNESFRGIGTNPAEEENHSAHNGIAMGNINHRIHLLFGNEYGLHIYSIKGLGTDVQVTLPLLLNHDENPNETAEPQEKP
jgi:two-component system sensor histidine kinase YesM